MRVVSPTPSLITKEAPVMPELRAFGLHLNPAHMKAVLDARDHWRRTLGHGEQVTPIPQRPRVLARRDGQVVYDSWARAAGG